MTSDKNFQLKSHCFSSVNIQTFLNQDLTKDLNLTAQLHLTFTLDAKGLKICSLFSFFFLKNKKNTLDLLLK